MVRGRSIQAVLDGFFFDFSKVVDTKNSIFLDLICDTKKLVNLLNKYEKNSISLYKKM